MERRKAVNSGLDKTTGRTRSLIGALREGILQKRVPEKVVAWLATSVLPRVSVVSMLPVNQYNKKKKRIISIIVLKPLAEHLDAIQI